MKERREVIPNFSKTLAAKEARRLYGARSNEKSERTARFKPLHALIKAAAYSIVTAYFLHKIYNPGGGEITSSFSSPMTSGKILLSIGTGTLIAGLEAAETISKKFGKNKERHSKEQTDAGFMRG